MQAIRATLDGGLVREVQKLNSSLVFLTIGIAGGPYLGLLGTVIGVMITFAVIAKSGQVEVNSIAPGIAGALLATVAGLAVAIPALLPTAISVHGSRMRSVTCMSLSTSSSPRSPSFTPNRNANPPRLCKLMITRAMTTSMSPRWVDLYLVLL